MYFYTQSQIPDSSILRRSAALVAALALPGYRVQGLFTDCPLQFSVSVCKILKEKPGLVVQFLLELSTHLAIQANDVEGAV